MPTTVDPHSPAELARCATDNKESLRDRKQRETRAAIHAAAVNRVLEDGLDNATVAAIADEANVSPRTFFNYFNSKEDAIVGEIDDAIAEADSQRFLADRHERGLFPEVVDLIHRSFLLTFSADEVAAKRRAVFAKNPQLMRRQMDRTIKLQRQVSDLVAKRLIADGQCSGNEDEAAAQAGMIVQICSAPLRFTMQPVNESDDHELDLPRAERRYQQAVKTFNNVLAGTK